MSPSSDQTQLQLTSCSLWQTIPELRSYCENDSDGSFSRWWREVIPSCFHKRSFLFIFYCSVWETIRSRERFCWVMKRPEVTLFLLLTWTVNTLYSNIISVTIPFLYFLASPVSKPSASAFMITHQSQKRLPLLIRSFCSGPGEGNHTNWWEAGGQPREAPGSYETLDGLTACCTLWIFRARGRQRNEASCSHFKHRVGVGLM